MGLSHFFGTGINAEQSELTLFTQCPAESYWPFEGVRIHDPSLLENMYQTFSNQNARYLSCHLHQRSPVAWPHLPGHCARCQKRRRASAYNRERKRERERESSTISASLSRNSASVQILTFAWSARLPTASRLHNLEHFVANFPPQFVFVHAGLAVSLLLLLPITCRPRSAQLLFLLINNTNILLLLLLLGPRAPHGFVERSRGRFSGGKKIRFSKILR